MVPTALDDRMDQSATIRIGLVGCGRIGLRHVEAVEALGGCARIAAVCDVDPGRAATAAVRTGGASCFTDLRAMLAAGGLDAVDNLKRSVLGRRRSPFPKPGRRDAVLLSVGVARSQKESHHGCHKQISHGCYPASSQTRSVGAFLPTPSHAGSRQWLQASNRLVPAPPACECTPAKITYRGIV